MDAQANSVRVSAPPPPPEQRPVEEKVLVFPSIAIDDRHVAAVHAFFATNIVRKTPHIFKSLCLVGPLLNSLAKQGSAMP